MPRARNLPLAGKTVKVKKLEFLFILALIGSLPINANCQNAGASLQKGRIWGYSFGDCIYKAEGDTLYWGNTEYAGLEKKTIGANLRRLFIGYDSPISEKLRVKTLVESKANTTTKEGRFGLAVIFGFLEWDDILKFLPNSKARIGLIPTPIFALPEKTWGYRSVEKDALDLRGIGKVIDQGFSISADLNKQKTAGFTIMVGNGTGNRPGVDKYLEYYASVYQKLWKNQFTVELLADYVRKSPAAKQSFLRGFVSIEKPLWTLGLEVTQSLSDEEVTGEIQAVNPLSASVFLSNRLGFLGDKWRSFLRYDFYNPATKYQPTGIYGSPSQHYDEHSVWLGLHYRYHEKVNFMPNLIVNEYKRKNENIVQRKRDIVPRLTVYFLFGDSF